MDFGGNVRTITVGAGSLFDLNGNNISVTAGTGLIKNGAGVYGTGTGTYSGGFTLNEGTVIARGTTGLGSGPANTLILNGGTIAGNASRTFDNTRFAGGITIGGDVQFGAMSSAVALASSTGNLSFANNVNIGTGSTRRTLTVGNDGDQTFSGVISGSGGLTFAARSGVTAGRFILSGANLFTGGLSITGGEVRITQDSALGNIANNIEIDGGLLGYELTSSPLTISASRQITLGNGNGSSDNGFNVRNTGTGASTVLATVNYDGVIANKSSETGILTKSGLGTLTLGGTSTYTGATAVKGGTLVVSTGGSIAQSSLTTVTTGTTLTANGTVGAVTVNLGGTLNGAGTVGTTTVAGTLTPGNSPGVLNVNGNLTMASGGNMVWELFANTATQVSPAAVFDQVLVSGDLAFAGSNGITLNFGTTAAGSTVAWSDSFWSSNRSFLIYDVAGSTTGFSNLGLLNTSFNDATGAALAASQGSFSVSQLGSDVFLNYNAIPEPSSASMLGLGFAGLVATRLLRRKNS
jgi:autotransporter-associated beta strand protein